MPETPIYGFEFETPQTKPGITLTGDIDGSSPILAEQVEQVIATVETRLTAVETSGYRYLSTQVYTASGVFTKGSYAGLRAVRVRVVGGGGQCGGAGATIAAQSSEPGAGAGGGYAESFIIESSLTDSVTVTIGAGGSGGAAGANGNAGASTSFGALLSATGGSGGIAMAGTSGNSVVSGSNGGVGSGGNILNISGCSGRAGLVIGGVAMRVNDGGSTMLAPDAITGTTTTAGQAGFNYGGGGGGTRNGASQAALAGAVGAPGIVIVDVYV